LLRLLDSLAIPPTFSLNSGVFDHYPELGALLGSRGDSIMAHGRYNTEYHNGLSFEEERELVGSSLRDIEEATGIRPAGWLGPGISGTANTPDVLAELAVTYHADWVLDDVPAEVEVRRGRLISVPYSFELNDSRLNTGAVTAAGFADMCLRQADVLVDEADGGAAVMAIALHTFISSQPHIQGALQGLLAALRGRGDVLFTTGEQIATWYLEGALTAPGREI